MNTLSPTGAAHRRRRVVSPLAGLALLVVATACGSSRLAVVGPVDDAPGAASALTEETRLETPLRIVFGWELNDAGQRVEGRGVARVEPPYRARLDLFLNNGETVMSAALVEGDFRLPAGAPDDILPPPDLLWGALGVFRPTPAARLLGGDRLEGEGVRLRYAYADGRELHYGLEEGAVRTLEVLAGDAVVERVEVALVAPERYPVEATYRNLAEFRELKLVRESLQRSEPFDSDIWDPRG